MCGQGWGMGMGCMHIVACHSVSLLFELLDLADEVVSLICVVILTTPPRMSVHDLVHLES